MEASISVILDGWGCGFGGVLMGLLFAIVRIGNFMKKENPPGEDIVTAAYLGIGPLYIVLMSGVCRRVGQLDVD